MTNKTAVEIDKKVGIAIRDLRLSRGLPREVFAKQLGVSHQQFMKYENGVNRLSLGRLVVICALLNVSLEEVLNFEPVESDRNRMLLEHMRMFSKLDKKKQTSFNTMLKAF